MLFKNFEDLEAFAELYRENPELANEALRQTIEAMRPKLVEKCECGGEVYMEFKPCRVRGGYEIYTCNMCGKKSWRAVP